MSYDQKSIWQKLRRRRAAVIAFRIIAISCLVALFAYPLSPDSSPDAARMTAEVKARPPGFTKLFLLQPLEKPAVKRPWFITLFIGQETTHRLIPVNGFYFVRDSIVVEHYIARGRQERLSFPLRSLLPPSMHKRKPGELQMAVYHDRLKRQTFPLGTDRHGRDILSRLLVGARMSIGTGIAAVILSMGIGILLGATAAYFRGRVDKIVMYLVDVLTVIPYPLLAFAITLNTGRGFLQICLAVGLSMWAGTARLIRSQVIAHRDKPYIEAAKTIGLSDMRILLRHIMPLIAVPLMAIAASGFASAILIEAGISFLGIGVQPPTPSWGLMIREHYDLITGRPDYVLIPGLAITILAGAFHMLGNALRGASGE